MPAFKDSRNFVSQPQRSGYRTVCPLAPWSRRAAIGLRIRHPRCGSFRGILTRRLLGILALSTLVSAAVAAAPAEGGSLRVSQLRCEYLVNPFGLDDPAPRLSWIVESETRGQRQSAYQVLVASSEEVLVLDAGDLWDSGKVASDATLQIAYAGRPLRSRMNVHWKVRVWAREGKPSAWSAPANWTMGLLDRDDWQAKWIEDPASEALAVTARAHNGYHSEFADRADMVKWVQIDLGGTRTFNAVRLFPARPYDWQPDTPAFLFPLRFRVEAANRPDFSDARLLLDRTAADEPSLGTNAPRYEFAPATGRFVRLTATRLRLRDAGKFGLALAELEVLDGTTNVASDKPVTALDSIETGPWAKANLVDGVRNTVPPGSGPGALPATMMRKSFRIGGDIRRATAYVSALGVYEMRLNGRRVGDQVLAPEWTSYRRRVQYQTYDVTALLRSGENAVAAAVGEGWYAGRLMVVGRFPYGHSPRLLAQIEIELADGSRQVIGTDDSWRTTLDGPIRSSGIYDGEVYDARREMSGWDQPGFDDGGWSRAKISGGSSPRLVAQRNEPIRVTRELASVTVTQPKPGVYVFDLGQNMVGGCRVRAQGRAGQPVTIRHAEMLNDDGTIYTANLRGAPQVDRFIPSADGEFTFEPHFTYHGFRFVELAGLEAAPDTNAIVGRAFHSAAPEVGTFECSDPSLTRLMSNIVWTQRANLMSTPNDCPQRDERFGWMGDIQAFAQTAIFNMDLAAFLTKFAQDVRDDQADDGCFPDFAPHPGDPNTQFSGAPAWADAGTIVPWRAYQNYADTRLLEAHFDAARRWVDYVRAHNPGLIWSTNRHNDYNDWLNGDWVRQKDWPVKGGSVPKEVFATAFFAHSADLVSRMAAALGRRDEAQRYGELFAHIKAAFNQRFVKPDGRIEGDTQAGYALALNFDLLLESLRSRAAAHLVEGIGRYHGHLSTGIQSAHRAMLELTRWGHEHASWQLLTNRTFPSWLYMLDNGATTIWERWDGYVKDRGFQDAGMNSFNHWAFGAVGEWMWRHIAGLNPDDAQPGWKHFTVHPRPGGGVTWARAEYQSIRGRISSVWRRDGDRFDLAVTIPANTTATVIVPAKDRLSISESGGPLAQTQGMSFVRMDGSQAVLEVESGSYRFQSVLK